MSTAAQRRHVATGTQTYRNPSNGADYGFWSLAPHTDFDAVSRRRLPKTREFVWLLRDQVAYEAIVDTATATILVMGRSIDHAARTAVA